MSAPTCRDPLAVTTTDGTRWVRAAVTRTGRGLYAVEDLASCPQFVMATLEELAEHGIRGRDPLADAVALMGALPMPVGSGRSELDRVYDDLAGANLARWEEEQESARLRLALESAKRGRRELRSRVAEMATERHTTNESLSDALVELRAAQDRIAELEAAAAPPWPESLIASSGAVIETAASADVRPQVDQLRGLLARPVSAKCRCGEPGADPYECEADDCSGHFSELNPFGSGARPVNEPSAEVSRTCAVCGWRTTVWHVDDGSAEAELHGHITRLHRNSEVTP